MSLPKQPKIDQFEFTKQAHAHYFIIIILFYDLYHLVHFPNCIHQKMGAWRGPMTDLRGPTTDLRGLTFDRDLQGLTGFWAP